MSTVQEPSRELIRLATRVEFGLGRYLTARGNDASRSKWEALRHSWALSNLTLRQAEGVCVLAKRDEVLLPAGWVSARAALESAARTLWLLEPSDEWEREARWLALIYEGARLDERLEVQNLRGSDAPRGAVKSFADAVAAKLPDGTGVPGIASISKMLEPYGSHLVGLYALASQYTHAADLAARQWRTNLGIDAAYGEYVSAAEWLLPLSISWQAFRVTAKALMSADETATPAELTLFDRQIEDAQESLSKASRPGSELY